MYLSTILVSNYVLGFDSFILLVWSLWETSFSYTF
jgi:hypothetical protein